MDGLDLEKQEQEAPLVVKELQKLQIQRVLMFDLLYSQETGESSKKNHSEAYLISDLLRVLLSKTGRNNSLEQLKAVKG